MEIVTRKGFLAKDTWDLDAGQSSIDVYDNDNDGRFVGTLYGRELLMSYENEDGEIDTDRLDDDIEDALL